MLIVYHGSWYVQIKIISLGAISGHVEIVDGSRGTSPTRNISLAAYMLELSLNRTKFSKELSYVMDASLCSFVDQLT